jgi:hypothetical protein
VGKRLNSRVHIKHFFASLLLVAGAVAASAHRALAQGTAPVEGDTSGRLNGRVLYEGQTVGIPYASVTLSPVGGSRFADTSGYFFFAHVAPGPVRVRARQIGFTPFDTTVTIKPGPAITTISLHLHRVQVQLARVTIRAKGPKACVKPGIPDSIVDPEIYTLFTQVRENVARLKILENDYPFHYRREEEWLLRQRGSSDQIEDMDTVDVESWHSEPYKPGEVVVSGYGRHGYPTQYMHLVQFQDLADPDFDSMHCFRIAEHAKGDDETLLELDFEPWINLNVPDVSGSIFLDANKLIVRRAEFHLTRPGEAAFRDWTYYSSFHEILPLVPVVSGFQSYAQSTQRPGTSIEEGRNLDYNFVRDAPVDQTVRDTVGTPATASAPPAAPSGAPPGAAPGAAPSAAPGAAPTAPPAAAAPDAITPPVGPKTIVAKAAFPQSADHPVCNPPTSQTIVEGLTGRILASRSSYTDPIWRLATKQLLENILAHFTIPSTIDVGTFGYAAPASATDAAGRGALRISPAIFGWYGLSFDQQGGARDAHVIATSLSPEVDSAVVASARQLYNSYFREQTVVFSVSTARPGDTTATISLAHIQVPSWLVTRQVTPGPGRTVSPASAVRSAGADTITVEFIVDDQGHPILSTIHRIDAAPNIVAGAESDQYTAGAADSLSTLVYQPALVGRCAVSQVTTRRFVFSRPRE